MMISPGIFFFFFFNLDFLGSYGGQAWRGRKRLAHGHHSPSSIKGEWSAIDDQKNNILAPLGLAS